MGVGTQKVQSELETLDFCLELCLEDLDLMQLVGGPSRAEVPATVEAPHLRTQRTQRGSPILGEIPERNVCRVSGTGLVLGVDRESVGNQHIWFVSCPGDATTAPADNCCVGGVAAVVVGEPESARSQLGRVDGD